MILNLPSGGIEKGESPLQTAAKELLEETGYSSTEVELIDKVYEYPSKLDHVLYIVRIKNAEKLHDVSHERTESISEPHLISHDMEDFGGIFDTTYAITALALTIPEYLKR